MAFHWSYISNLVAYRVRYKTLTAPVRPSGVAKISKAGENLKKRIL